MTHHIENSDRGLTISKPLAWSMATGLALAALWLGTEVGSIRTELRTVNEKVTTTVDRQSVFNRRLGQAEVEAAAASATAQAMSSSLERIEGKLDRIDERLRRQERQP